VALPKHRETVSPKGDSMLITRSKSAALTVIAAIALLAGSLYPAKADDKRHALYGTWHVRCPAGHVDVVTDGTRQHKCETCGKQCFVNGKVTIMCPKGHANDVSLADVDVLRSYKCRTKACRAECEGWK
jgi:hypothetical protein